MRRISTYHVVGLFCLAALSATAQQVRVMQWNVEKGLGNSASINNSQARALARVVNYNQPDILLFNEVDARNNRTVAQNEAAIIAWITNNVPYLGTQTGVTFFVKASSRSDGSNRNAAVSRFPILTAGTYTNAVSARGLHAIRVQLSGTNQLQVYHAHLKCCADDCPRKQNEAQFDSDVIKGVAATNATPYIFAGDWNEEEEAQPPVCTLSATYHPISTIRTNGGLTEFKPTTLSGDHRTWSTGDPSPFSNIRFDYILAATNRLSPVYGFVFSTMDWAAHGLYTNASLLNLVLDSRTASDHYCVFVNYAFPTSASNFNVTPATAFTSSGNPGGPFGPSSQVYALTNSDTIPLFWSVTKTSSWLTVSTLATNLTLGAGRSTNITVSINSTANSLSAGAYMDTIHFSNTATGVSISRGVTLTVGAPPPSANFSGSPISGTAPLAVIFSDASTGSITNRFWDFGDTSTTNTTTNSVSHIYADGQYTVRLIVSGPGGVSTNTKPNYISVLTPFQSWQIQYFGETNNPAAATDADPDGDGCDNLCEFLAGTNPTNSASTLRITSIALEDNDIRITWMTGVAKTNALQFSAGAGDGSYSNDFYDLFVVTNTTGDVTNHLDTGAATNIPARYYRIRLVP